MFTSIKSARSECRPPLTGGGRLAAAIQRAGLKIVSAVWALWAMLFADDYDLTGEGSTYKEAMLGFVWWLVVLGVQLCVACFVLELSSGYTWVSSYPAPSWRPSLPMGWR